MLDTSISIYCTILLVKVCLSLLTITSLNQMREVLLFVCSTMTDKTFADGTREV